MPRETRTRDRSRRHRISPQRKKELTDYEIAEKKVRELEAKLKQTDKRLAEDAKRLAQNYGLNVRVGDDSYTSVQNEVYMSPIRIGVNEQFDNSSPIRINTPEPYRDASPPHFDYPQRKYGEYDLNGFVQKDYAFKDYPRIEPTYDTSLGIQFPYHYEHPPGFQTFDHKQPSLYPENVDVRVDEMPMWPMHGESSSEDAEKVLEQNRTFSPTPIWRHNQDVQVDPMPVFPMNGEEPEKPSVSKSRKQRDEKVRLQMLMIAQQAELAEKQRTQIGKKEQPGGLSNVKEKDEQREARHAISIIRDKVLQQMKLKEKERDERKRDIEREKRHALKRKEEEEATKKRDERRAHDSYTRQSECDEFFLKYLNPAIGSIKCVVTRIKGKDPIEYVAKCHATNIPKELLYGSKVHTMKGESYKGAIISYVDKLALLGVIGDRTRKLMKRIEKLPKFLAEMVEPLCNDIAIYGTQISVTDVRDMRSRFESFAKDKSAQFWSAVENANKLTDFIKRYDRKRSRSRSRSCDEKKATKSSARDRRRQNSMDRLKAQSPSHSESLKQLFATTGNSIHLSQSAAPAYSQMHAVNPSVPTTNSFSSPQPAVSSLMNIPVAPQPQPPLMGSYIPSSPGFYASQQQYNSQIVNGYSQYSQLMQHQHPSGIVLQTPPYQQQLGLNQQNISYQHPMPSSSNQQIHHPSETDLMDEIFE